VFDYVFMQVNWMSHISTPKMNLWTGITKPSVTILVSNMLWDLSH